MTQEDKELSFIDISGRLHYGVIVNYRENEYDHRKWKITSLHTFSYSKSGTLIDTDYDGWISYEEHQGCGMSTGSRPFRFGEVLPYLRPMSSMTEEERKELNNNIFGDSKHPEYFTFITFISPNASGIIYNGNDNCCCINIGDSTIDKLIDWLNAHHFDYRNLIEKNLALDCTGLHIYDY